MSTSVLKALPGKLDIKRHLVFSMYRFLILDVFLVPRHFQIAWYYVLPSIQRKMRSNVRLSVCMSVSLSVHLFVCPSVWPSVDCFHSLQEAFFNQFDIGKECPGIADGYILEISTELRPLIDVRNWFSLSIFGILYRFSSNLG